ncbi:hypothetical protein SDRG_14943, partial [Saprolegnia diclina VS20]
SNRQHTNATTSTLQTSILQPAHWLRNLPEAGHLPIVEIMSVPPTAYAIFGAVSILPALCIGQGAWQMGRSLAEKSTGKDAALVRPFEGLFAGITTIGALHLTGDAALRRFKPQTVMSEAILSASKPYASQTITAGAIIAGVYVFHVVGALSFAESTSSSMASSSND